MELGCGKLIYCRNETKVDKKILLLIFTTHRFKSKFYAKVFKQIWTKVVVVDKFY